MSKCVSPAKRFVLFLFYVFLSYITGLFLLSELISPGLLLCSCCVISSFVTSFSYEILSKIFLPEYITRFALFAWTYDVP